MLLHLTHSDIFWRIFSTFVGAALIGLDRGERGHAAGLRTTLLVGLAACLAMLQTNALLDMTGKTSESFAVMDLMRLPLGILSGIGFIGGGAILKKEQLVIGVTTAATLWFVTVIGLCFGGGQMVIGWSGTALGLIVLTLLRRMERHIPKQIMRKLTVLVDQTGPTEHQIRDEILKTHMKIETLKTTHFPRERQIRVEWSLRYNVKGNEDKVPPIVPSLSAKPGALLVEWS